VVKLKIIYRFHIVLYVDSIGQQLSIRYAHRGPALLFNMKNKKLNNSIALTHLSVFLLGTSMSAVWADDEFGEDAFMEDFPVILSVTRLPQKTNEVPASVTVIDREMIDASGATEIAELFRLVPGFQVGHYIGPDGQRTSVSYHGNSDQYARRMQVLVDGRSIYLPSTGGVSWDDLSIGMNEIDRIEVIRGPNGVTYGANAFQATINIITLHAGATHGNEYSLISAGPKEYQAGVRVGGSRGALDYRINLQYETSEGFDKSVEFFKDRNDDSDTLKLNIRTDYQMGVNNTLNLSLGYTTGTREIGHSVGGLNEQKDPLAPLFDPVRDQQVKSSYQNLKFQHIISSEQEVNLQIYHNVHNLENSFQTALISEMLGVTPAVLAGFGVDDGPLSRNLTLFDERVGIELSHQFRLGSGIRFVWGGELRQDRFRGYDWVGGTSETFSNNSQRLFFNGEWSPAERWTVNIGDMLEKSDYMDMKHSPRLAVSWDIAKQHYVRMGISRAWRSPTFIESEFDYSLIVSPIIYDQKFISSEGLRPERIDVKEIAFGGGGRTSGIEYELRLFQEDMADILVMPTDDSCALVPADITNGVCAVVTNDGQSHVNGSELALTFYPLQPGSKLRIGYSRLHPSGEIADYYAPYRSRDVADLVPEETLNILFSQKVGKDGLLGVNFYRVSSMQFMAGDPTDGFSTINISYHHPVNILGHKAKMSVIAQDYLGSYFDFEKETVTKSQLYLGIKGDF